MPNVSPDSPQRPAAVQAETKVDTGTVRNETGAPELAAIDPATRLRVAAPRTDGDFEDARARAEYSDFAFVEPDQVVGTRQGGIRDSVAAQLGGSASRWTGKLLNRTT